MAQKLREKWGSKTTDASKYFKGWNFSNTTQDFHHFNDSSSRLGNMVEDDAPLTLDDEPNTPRASSPPPFFTDLPPSTQDDVWRFMLARKTDTGIANDFAEAFHLSLPQSQDFVSWFLDNPRHETIPGKALFDHVFELYSTEKKLELPSTIEEFRSLISHISHICDYKDLLREFNRTHRTSGSRDDLKNVLQEGLQMYTMQNRNLTKSKTKDPTATSKDLQDSADWNLLVFSEKDKNTDPLEQIKGMLK
jgi:hypothetical protein